MSRHPKQLSAGSREMLNLFGWFSLSLLLGLTWAQGSPPSRTYLPPPVTAPAAPANPPQEAIITKQFYSISPAEDPEDLEPRNKHLVIGQPRRNYRVIFIRAPAASSERLRYTAELAPQEERTVIYVLTKKQHELEATDIVAPREKPQAEQKPDIFFIKYKTNEEAAAAQREIQTQYDQLGGNSEIAAPYVAPVRSVVGALNPPQQQMPYQASYQSSSPPYQPQSPPSGGGYHYDRPSATSTSTLLAPVERSY